MSNIYNRGLEYQILPSGKRVLQYPTGNTVPQYALVGNLKPNLDWKTNRMIQPLTQTKQPMKEPPFVPKNPVRANSLGGRKPYDIDYIIPPRKPKPSTGLLWEPNTIREMRQNVYPDGLPKNNIPVQSADSSYLEQKGNLAEMKRLEEQIKLGRPDRGDLKELENQLEERQYKANPYKNVALSVEGHRIMAEREAKAIKDELRQLREKNREATDDLLYGLTEGKVELGDVRQEREKIKKYLEAFSSLPASAAVSRRPSLEGERKETSTEEEKLASKRKKEEKLQKELDEKQEEQERIERKREEMEAKLETEKKRIEKKQAKKEAYLKAKREEKMIEMGLKEVEPKERSLEDIDKLKTVVEDSFKNREMNEVKANDVFEIMMLDLSKEKELFDKLFERITGTKVSAEEYQSFPRSELRNYLRKIYMAGYDLSASNISELKQSRRDKPRKKSV